MTNYTLMADDELVKLFCAGQNNAFDELLLRYKDRLYSYISYLVKNDDMADDLFQETFVKAIMTIRQGRYQSSGKFYAWLTRIAHNLLIDQFREESNLTLVYNDEKKTAGKRCKAMSNPHARASWPTSKCWPTCAALWNTCRLSNAKWCTCAITRG